MPDAPPSANDPTPGAPPPLPPHAPHQGGGPGLPADPVTWRTFFWVFCRFDGRIGRQVYWLSVFFLVVLLAASGIFVIDPNTEQMVLNFGPLQSFIYMASSISSITISIKRLHDLNMTGFFALGLLIPPIAVILTIWLGVRKGDDKPNRFGWASDVMPNGPPLPNPMDED